MLKVLHGTIENYKELVNANWDIPQFVQKETQLSNNILA